MGVAVGVGGSVGVGGGSGVVPLMAMVRHRTLRKSAVPVALMFSVRIWDEVIFRDELVGKARAASSMKANPLALTDDELAEIALASL